jgi:hypothetical protein
MDVVKLLQSRAMIATILLFSFLMLEDHGAARGIDDSELTVTAQIDEEPPICQGMGMPLSFSPAVDSTSGGSAEGIIYIELPNTSDVIYVDFQIVDGYTEDCEDIFGSVTFSESGFVDQTDSSPVSFLDATFECDMNQTPLTADINDVFSCGVIGGQSSPVSLEMNVTADADSAYTGYFVNTLSIDLYANP